MSMPLVKLRPVKIFFSFSVWFYSRHISGDYAEIRKFTWSGVGVEHPDYLCMFQTLDCDHQGRIL